MLPGIDVSTEEESLGMVGVQGEQVVEVVEGMRVPAHLNVQRSPVHEYLTGIRYKLQGRIECLQCLLCTSLTRPDLTHIAIERSAALVGGFDGNGPEEYGFGLGERVCLQCLHALLYQHGIFFVLPPYRHSGREGEQQDKKEFLHLLIISHTAMGSSAP